MQVCPETGKIGAILMENGHWTKGYLVAFHFYCLPQSCVHEVLISNKQVLYKIINIKYFQALEMSSCKKSRKYHSTIISDS